MRSEEEKKEQKRKAQKKYYEKNKEYYRKQSLNEAKRVRQERKIYKETIDKAIKYIKENACYGIQEKCCVDDLNYDECDKLLKILEGANNNEQ